MRIVDKITFGNAGMRRALLRLYLLFVLSGAVSALTEISAPLFFLRHFSAAYYPMITFGTQIILLLLGILPILLSRPLIILIFSAVFQMVFWVALEISDAKLVTFIYTLFITVQNSVLRILPPILQSSLFDAIQLKQKGGFTRTAYAFASMAAGFLIALYIKELGIISLPPLNAACLLLFLYEYSKILKFVKEKEMQDDLEKESTRNNPLFQYSPYVLLIMGLIFTTGLISIALKTLFYDAGHLYYNDVEFAALLSICNALFSLFGLLMTLFLYHWLMIRFRLDYVFFFVPAITFLFLGASLFATVYPLSNSAIFWSQALTYVIFGSSIFSIFNPAQLLLLQVFTLENRTRLLKYLLTFASSISSILGSLAILLINYYIGFSIFSFFVLITGTLIALSIIIALTYRTYVNELKNFLFKGRLAATSFSIDNPILQQVFLHKLQDKNPDTIVRIVALLTDLKDGNSLLDKKIPTLLFHPAASVRKSIYEHLCKFPQPALFPILKTQLEKECPENQSQLLRALYECGKEQALEVLEPYALSDIREIKNTAIACFMRQDESAMTHLADQYLHYSSSPSKEEKLNFLTILTEADVDLYEDRIGALLMDEDSDVRLQTLELASKRKFTTIWPSVISNLSHPQFHLQAFVALKSAGSAARPYLTAALKEDKGSKKHLLLLLAETADLEFLNQLIELYPKMNGAFRIQLLDTLSFDKEIAIEAENLMRESLLQIELADAIDLICILIDIDARGWTLLSCALSEELQQCYERLLHLIALFYPTSFSKKMIPLYFGKPNVQNLVIEFLDNILTDEDNSLILRLLKINQIDQNTKTVIEDYNCSFLNPMKRLKKILANPERWNNPWIPACAIFTCSQNHYTKKTRLVERFLGSKNPLLAKIAANELPKLLETFTKTDDSISRDPFELLFILQNSNLFSTLKQSSLFNIVAFSTYLTLVKGQVLFKEGDISDSVYFLIKGKLFACRNEQVLAEITDGEVFGGLGLVTKSKRAATIIAEESSILLKLSEKTIHRLVIEDRAGLMTIAKALCEPIKKQSTSSAKFDKELEISFKEKEASHIEHIAHDKEETPLMDRILILRSIELFEELSNELLILLAEEISEVSLSSGEILMKQGDPGTTMYILCDGCLEVYRDLKKVGEITENQVVGEMGALTLESRSATVIAVKDSKLLEISQVTLRSLFSIHPQIIDKFLTVLAMRAINN